MVRSKKGRKRGDIDHPESLFAPRFPRMEARRKKEKRRLVKK